MIEAGEYYRTQKGYIHKIIKIYEEYGHNSDKFLKIKVEDDDCSFLLDKTAVTKHSKNIIDLIEVGDYVNGKLVSNVDKVDNENIIEWDNGDMYKTEIQNDKFIESIVTHEQFASMEYKIKEDK